MHYNYKRYLKQFVRLFANISQYIGDNIILPNITLCMPHNRGSDNMLPPLPYNILQGCLIVKFFS